MIFFLCKLFYFDFDIKDIDPKFLQAFIKNNSKYAKSVCFNTENLQTFWTVPNCPASGYYRDENDIPQGLVIIGLTLIAKIIKKTLFVVLYR